MFFLIGKSAPFDANVFRQMLACYFFEYSHRLSRTITRGRFSRYSCGGEHIEPTNSPRTCCIRGCTKSGNRYHGVIASFDEEEPQIIFMCSIRCFGLDIYTVDSVEHIEIVHIDRPRKCFERRKNIGYFYSEHLGLVPIYIKIKLRYIVLNRRR